MLEMRVIEGDNIVDNAARALTFIVTCVTGIDLFVLATAQ